MTEQELRAEFERQHSGRNLSVNRNGNYYAINVQICWRQHQRTARWMEERANLQLLSVANAAADRLYRDLVDDPS